MKILHCYQLMLINIGILFVKHVTCFYISTYQDDKQRIYNGGYTEISLVPHQVTYELRTKLVCGGCITTARWILTAYHCFLGTSIRIILRHGKIRSGTSFRESEGDLFAIVRVILNPDYDEGTMDGDLALVQIDPLMIFNLFQQPIPISTSRNVPEKNDLVQISGFGETDPGSTEQSYVIKEGFVTVIDHQDCVDAYEDYEPITSNMFCATSVPDDTCNGDSGGPAVLNGKLIGIISGGDECGNPLLPGVYVKLTPYLAWISLYTLLDLSLSDDDQLDADDGLDSE